MKTEAEIRRMLETMRWFMFDAPPSVTELVSSSTKTLLTGVISALLKIVDEPPRNRGETECLASMDLFFDAVRIVRDLNNPERN